MANSNNLVNKIKEELERIKNISIGFIENEIEFQNDDKTTVKDLFALSFEDYIDTCQIFVDKGYELDNTQNSQNILNRLNGLDSDKICDITIAFYKMMDLTPNQINENPFFRENHTFYEELSEYIKSLEKKIYSKKRLLN